jgi:hypothetical protein
LRLAQRFTSSDPATKVSLSNALLLLLLLLLLLRLLLSCWHHLLQCCTKAKHDFVSKIFLASGISTTMTAVPACIQPVHTDEPKMDLNNAQAECKLVYGQVISEVLRKTGKHDCNASPSLPGLSKQQQV